jgi:hypothetical protein
VVIGALLVTAAIGLFRFDGRLARIESALDLSPTADSLQRITALETRMTAFEGGGARWSRGEALVQAAEIRGELAGLERDLRGEIARLRDRVDRLHNHVGGGW